MSVPDLLRTRPACAVFLSRSHDPYVNLAFENWLFEHLPDHAVYLILWSNDPSVVIGRFQNPWLECDLKGVKVAGVHLVRRQSGGGTVYHDRGNLVFTFMSRRDVYHTARHFQIILDALEGLGVKAAVNDRNDILLSGHKISGSSFRLTPRKAFHHGTLLVSTELDRLHRFLLPPRTTMETCAVASVRSPVMNIAGSYPHVTVPVLETALAEAFSRFHGVECIDPFVMEDDWLQNQPDFSDYHVFLRSPQWLFEKTPPFTVSLRGVFEWGQLSLSLRTEHGRVTACEVTDCDFLPAAERLPGILKGRLCHQLHLLAGAAVGIVAGLADDPEMVSILQWLSREFS